MFRLKSLRLKLVACFLLVTLIPLGVTGIYGHFFTSSTLSQQALERSVHQVHLQAESIVSALRQVQGDALYLAALRSLNMLRQQTNTSQISLWKREVEQDLLVLASVRPMYHAIRLINAEGDEIISIRAEDRHVGVTTDLQNRRGTSYFDQTIALPPNGVYVSPFQTDDDEGVPYVHYAVRLRDGVLVIDLHAGWLLRALPEHPGADTWALIDQDGRFMVYPEGFEPASVAADIPALLAGEGGSFESATGVYVFDLLYPVAQTDPTIAHEQYWVIFRLTPAAVLYASVNDFYHLAVLLAVMTVGAAVLLALGISRVLVNPVKRLQAMTIQFGKSGIAPDRPAHISDDEIGALTRTFLEIAHELAAKRRQEHRLIERLIRAQEEERKLVAYDLHDGLIQQMVGARFYFNHPGNGCRTCQNDARTIIQKGCDALSEAIVEGRRIIEGLRPAALDDLGLTAAVREIAEQIAATAGWNLTLELQPLPEPSKTTAVTVYRIAQEALNNARKHAKAKNVRISLHNGTGIHLTIEDDGIGFEPAQLAEDDRGLGITTMHERASLIHGTCKITSARGQGTRVDVSVPRELTPLSVDIEVEGV